jgi:KAP family P-loop domain
MNPPPGEDSGSDAARFSSASEALYAQSSSVGDEATADDSLGFRLYVEALASFLVSPNTHAPLTLSIEGAWGCGKSSFMLQLKKRLKAKSPDAVAIDFNAWKYEKQEELWAAFALSVARSLREQTPFFRRIRGDILLYCSRIKGFRESVILLAKLLAWLAVFVLFAGGVYWSGHTGIRERDWLLRALWKHEPDRPMFPDWVYTWVTESRWWTGLLLLVGVTWKVPKSSRKSLFEIRLEEYIDKPDYKGEGVVCRCLR